MTPTARPKALAARREFLFDLAGHLGRTVAELEAGLSVEEFGEWERYAATVGPLGPKRADYHAALVARAYAGGRLADYLLHLLTRQRWSPEQVRAGFALFAG